MCALRYPAGKDSSRHCHFVQSPAEEASGRDPRERVVGVALLLKGCAQDVRILRVTQVLGKGPRGAIASDLVVLDPVGRGDQDCVPDTAGPGAAHMPPRLPDQPADGLAVLTAGVQSVTAKDVLKPSPVRPGFTHVLLEGPFQVAIRDAVGQVRQRGDQLGFGAVKVAQLVEVKLFKVRDHRFREIPAAALRAGVFLVPPPYRILRAVHLLDSSSIT